MRRLPGGLGGGSGEVEVTARRPYLGNGSCLSCHGSDLPVLPTRSCLSCHRGNMDFLERAAGASAIEDPTLAMGAAALGGALVLGVALTVAWRMRRTLVPLVVALTAATGLAAIRLGGTGSEASRAGETGSGATAAFPGAILVTRETAADLIPVLSPAGDALLFTHRSEDTTGDGLVDIRDGQALFLLRRGDDEARRVTPSVLDFAGAMARFTRDGSRFVVPVPTGDTDSDGRVTFADRHGLVLFGNDGVELARLDPTDLDLTDPLFTPDGQRVVAVEGRGLLEWEWGLGATRQILDPSPDGTFPRLAGWDSARGEPLFTRGQSYRFLPRDGSRRYERPVDIPLEAVGASVSPHGGGHRRSRTEMAHGDLVFYLDERPDGSRRLCRHDSGGERCAEASERYVLAAAAMVDGGAAFLAASRRGEVGELFVWEPSGSIRSTRLRVGPGLVGLAAERYVLLAGPEAGGARPLTLFDPRSEATRHLGGETDLWYNPVTAGRAVGGVRVPHDTDGDGKRTPLDIGELWIAWEAP